MSYVYRHGLAPYTTLILAGNPPVWGRVVDTLAAEAVKWAAYTSADQAYKAACYAAHGAMLRAEAWADQQYLDTLRGL